MHDSKIKRRHPERALSAVGIKALSEPGRYADGNGLYLVVDPSGSTLVRLGQEVCKTPEEFKTWSQNLEHEEVLTTFRNDGNIEAGRQASIIKSLGQRNSDRIPMSELSKLFENFLNQQNAKAS